MYRINALLNSDAPISERLAALANEGVMGSTLTNGGTSKQAGAHERFQALDVATDQLLSLIQSDKSDVAAAPRPSPTGSPEDSLVAWTDEFISLSSRGGVGMQGDGLVALTRTGAHSPCSSPL